MNTDWMARGKCKEVAPDIFFPNDGMGVLVAQRICAECPVSEPAWSTRSSTTSTTASGVVRRSVSAAASCAAVGSPTPSSPSSTSPRAASTNSH